jgi:hypothetical protein
VVYHSLESGDAGRDNELKWEKITNNKCVGTIPAFNNFLTNNSINAVEFGDNVVTFNRQKATKIDDCLFYSVSLRSCETRFIHSFIHYMAPQSRFGQDMSEKIPPYYCILSTVLPVTGPKGPAITVHAI